MVDEEEADEASGGPFSKADRTCDSGTFLAALVESGAPAGCSGAAMAGGGAPLLADEEEIVVDDGEAADSNSPDALANGS